MLGGVATLGLLISLGQVSPSLELRAETGGGQAPVIPGQPSELGFSAVLEPQGQVRIGASRNVVTARYSPRVSWRRPNAIQADRPLLLHNVELGADLHPGHRTTVQATSRLSVGEPDYTALQSLFGRSQGALPEIDEILDLALSLEVGARLAKRSTIGVQAEFGHRRPLGEVMVPAGEPAVPGPGRPGGEVVLFGHQTGISGGPFFTHRLTLVDTLMLLTDVAYERRDPDVEFLISFVRAGWERRLSPAQTLSLSAGVAYAKVEGVASPGVPAPAEPAGSGASDGSENSFSPVASVGYAAQLTRTQGAGLSLRGNLSVMNVVDPVINVAGPRAGLDLGFDHGFAARWVCSGTGSFSTNLKHQERLDESAAPPDETMAAFALVLRHRPSPTLAFDVGMRWSDRGANLRDDRFDLHQRELWGFVSATLKAR